MTEDAMTQQPEDLGSFSPKTTKIPTEQAEKPWAELERLAVGFGIGENWSAEGQNVVLRDDSVKIYIAETNPRCEFEDDHAEHVAAFIAAANPATVLKLIEAARASQVGILRQQNEPQTASADAGEGALRSVIGALEKCVGSTASVRVYANEAKALLAALRQTSSEPVGPQVCNVCEGFVPTWGVKVCQCEYMAPAGMKPAPAEPEYAAGQRVRVLEEALRDARRRPMASGDYVGAGLATAALNPQSQEIK